MKTFGEILTEGSKVMYHASNKKLTSLKKDPMWFSHDLKQAAAWKNVVSKDHGKAYSYEMKISGKIADYKDSKIKKLFKDANEDQNGYDIDLTSNPNEKQVNSFEGTILLKKNGYVGYTYLDYDPLDFQKDHPATIIFEPNKNVKIIKEI
jgi:hypothetical protein